MVTRRRFERRLVITRNHCKFESLLLFFPNFLILVFEDRFSSNIDTFFPSNTLEIQAKLLVIAVTDDTKTNNGTKKEREKERGRALRKKKQDRMEGKKTYSSTY